MLINVQTLWPICTGTQRLSLLFPAILMAGVVSLSGCAGGPEASLESSSPMGSAGATACKTSENLLVDTQFTRQGEYVRAWRMAQHTGELSFSTEVTDGILEIRRIATQPWMLFRQTVSDSRLSGATIRYSAELKGDLPDEPKLHGFDHIGGLYLKVGRGEALLAEHEPHNDHWEWQEFAYEQRIPLGVTDLRAGFVHQSGGVLWARNPSLVILDCE